MLENDIALVTGASRGIGQAIAHALVSKGLPSSVRLPLKVVPAPLVSDSLPKVLRVRECC